jgi:hypothetical protein
VWYSYSLDVRYIPVRCFVYSRFDAWCLLGLIPVDRQRGGTTQPSHSWMIFFIKTSMYSNTIEGTTLTCVCPVSPSAPFCTGYKGISPLLALSLSWAPRQSFCFTDLLPRSCLAVFFGIRPQPISPDPSVDHASSKYQGIAVCSTPQCMHFVYVPRLSASPLYHNCFPIIHRRVLVVVVCLRVFQPEKMKTPTEEIQPTPTGVNKH